MGWRGGGGEVGNGGKDGGDEVGMIEFAREKVAEVEVEWKGAEGESMEECRVLMRDYWV